MEDLTLQHWIMMGLYVVLCAFWFGVAVLILGADWLRPLPISSKRYKWLVRMSFLVALSLFLDSAYWMIALAFDLRLSNPDFSIDMRAPSSTIVIKSIVLISAMLFFSIVLKYRRSVMLHDEHWHFSRFMNMTQDAIEILDTKRRIKLWNRSAERLFKADLESVKGEQVLDRFTPSTRQQEMGQILDTIDETGEPKINYRIERRATDGQLIPVYATTSPIQESEFSGYFQILRDARAKRGKRKFRVTHLSPHENSFAFVACPFTTEMENIWNYALKPAIEANGLMAIRADKVPFSGKILDRLFNDIYHAAVVITDLTGLNPNVMYERGLADGLDKIVIQLIDQTEKLPFNVAADNAILYNPQDLEDLRHQLETVIAVELDNGQQDA